MNNGTLSLPVLPMSSSNGWRRYLRVLTSSTVISRRQIPWDKNEEKLAAWREARTGFPFIDAIMTQLKDEGYG